MQCVRLIGSGCFLLALAAASSSDKALSATATTTFQVTADVLVTCTIGATPMIFGDYVGLQINAQSTLLVTCTNTAQWVIGLNQGTAPGATVTTRQMTGPPPFFLNYQLSTDGSHSVNWGNTVGTDTVAGTGTGTVQVVTVFGVVPPGQTTAGPGGYVDTITATITF
jgi:spore coat protein U-like protein